MRGHSISSMFQSSGFFAIRTPLLPIEALIQWTQGAESSAALNPNDLDAAIKADRTRFRSRLAAIFAQPAVREALFLASPDLESKLSVWLDNPESEQGEKVERPLVRYFVRMAVRPTPFGLFAGASVGAIADKTEIRLADSTSYRRHTRLDMDYIFALTDAIARDEQLRKELIYRANSSLYRIGEHIRYVEAKQQDQVRSHHLVSVTRTEYLDRIVSNAESGARITDLAQALITEDPDVSMEEAEAFLHELIDNQLLVPVLSSNVSGSEAIVQLLHHLKETKYAENVRGQLHEVKLDLEKLDREGIGVNMERYRAIGHKLEHLASPVELSKLFQVDLVKPLREAALGHEVTKEILRGVQALHQTARKKTQSNMDRFRRDFLERYEGRQVPLTEVLDNETGIGYGGTDMSIDASSLLAGLPFPVSVEQETAWGKREILLLRKLNEAIASGTMEIRLTDHDLEVLSPGRALPMPDTFAAMVRVAARTEEALNRGDFQVLMHDVSGPSGARLLGRFCHADRDLHHQVTKHLRSEEALHPEAVFAEIVHLPEGRVGNLIARPVLRAYEIPFLAQSGAPLERQIPLNDLLVSVVGQEVVLWSATLGKRVIPRLSTAHNFLAHGIGPYRFLCDLQGNGRADYLAWDWGPLTSAQFLPRVVFGRTVLSRAIWRIPQDELSRLGRLKGGDRFWAVQDWRKGRGLPPIFLFTELDRELPVDLDNVLSVDTFVEMVKNRSEVRLTELFPSLEEQVVRGPEGRFVHEFIVPFERIPSKKNAVSLTSIPSEQPYVTSTKSLNIQRAYPPGSEWLYAKFYTGPAAVDALLRTEVRRIVSHAMRSGAVEQWFYIRYGDPDWHLRLRVKGVPERLLGEVLPELKDAIAPKLQNGTVWRFQVDTYMPEWERYGGEKGMSLAERFFHIDSEAVINILETLDGDAGLDDRWRLSFIGIDRLLSDLRFPAEVKSGIVKKARDGFATEFGIDGAFRRSLGERFRRERTRLEAYIHTTSSGHDRLAPGISVFKQRSERLVPLVDGLRKVEISGGLTVTLEQLAASYIHMHVNRMLRSSQRAHELIIYDFLARLYDAESGRTRRGDTHDE
ncbi:Nisin biosynthesis protein NisB [Paenibacillus allorhizosphaerae]|uniref:Nisin biosynthesis protein NisB n=2 Tax=Paenibacillus allorhizosphaerae TaxID=2849866 RepID=A0ABN7TY86_9BACL|nr:Nisin biosynthesis protein NisB [Paenibacillus allorhizosphaerae]